jgi:hypothetical protein
MLFGVELYFLRIIDVPPSPKDIGILSPRVASVKESLFFCLFLPRADASKIL